MKKLGKIVPLSAVLALGALLITGCPRSEKKNLSAEPPPAAVSSENPPAPPRRIQVEEYGLTLTAPGDWTISRSDKNPILFGAPAGAQEGGPYFTLVVENISRRMTPYDYLQANIITMRAGLPKLKVEKAGLETIAGVPMGWIEYSYLKNGRRMKALSYCQTRDYTAFVLTAVAREEEFSGYEALFRTIGRSLRVEQ